MGLRQSTRGAVANERLSKAMVGAEPMLHGGLIYDYDWTKHGESATIVDVGSGIGGAAIGFTKVPKVEDHHAGQARSYRVCERGMTTP